MADDPNIKNFTAADIERYQRGQLSPKEMHALEKAALDDPFLADALEGYAMPGLPISADIAELKQRLAEKTKESKIVPLYGADKKPFPWLRAAVMLVLLAGAAILSYQFLFAPGTTNPDIAQTTTKANESANTVQSSPVLTDAKKPDTAVMPDNSTANSPSGTTNSESKSEVAVNLNAVNANSGVSKELEGKVAGIEVDDKAAPVATNPTVSSVPTGTDVKTQPTEGAQNKLAAEEKTDNIKATELARQKKAVTNSDGDGVKDRTDNGALSKSTNAADKNLSQQYRSTPMNIFRGQVLDVNNNPLPFTNVTNSRDNVGTYSDAKGNFVLLSSDSLMDVTVRSLGYENSRIRLQSNLSNNAVKLREDKSLPEMVVSSAKRNTDIKAKDGNLTFEEPTPADGWPAYDSYLANNMNEVPEAFDVKKNSGSDAVELSFEVNKNGEPVNIRIEKSLCDKCDKEAIRLIKEGPKWKRKAKKGKRTTVTVPFVKTD